MKKFGVLNMKSFMVLAVLLTSTTSFAFEVSWKEDGNAFDLSYTAEGSVKRGEGLNLALELCEARAGSADQLKELDNVKMNVDGQAVTVHARCVLK